MASHDQYSINSSGLSDSKRPIAKQKNSSMSNLQAAADPTNDPFYGLSFKVGVAENKNVTYRAKMEDVHTYVANFAEKLDWGYFAIFDGHAGKQTARWCGNNLHTLLEHEIVFNEDGNSNNLSNQGNEVDNSAPLSSKSFMQDYLNTTFTKADELIEKEKNGSSGCTAAVAVLRWETDDSNESVKLTHQPQNDAGFDFIPSPNHKRMLYTSNVGDLRIVLYRNGKSYRLTYDHKATDSNEVNRIRDSGGLIMKNRVNGVLAVTRSLGDSYMKDLVIGNPFTTATKITDEDEFMILACDGVWDVISDIKACQFVAEAFKKDGNDPQLAAKKLCQLAMDNATTDNVTVMIVKFDRQVFASQQNTT
mmetsp:Transcript_2834/g.3164  ORF Transcript_2834/g.3164 Transcript_2834/m.3164 type:complete len:363 (+) Transcript_2834:61-1149(+)